MTNFMKLLRRPAVRCKSIGRIYPCLLFVVALLASEASLATCQLALSQPRVDYGVMRQAPDEHVSAQSYGTRTVLLNVVCIDPVPMAVRFSGVPAGPLGFRFGATGAFALNIRHAHLDGRPVELVAESSVPAHASERLVPGQVLIARAAGVPITGRRLSAQLEIAPFLPVDAFSVRSETTLQGQVLVEWLSHGVGVSPATPPSQ